VLVFKRGSVLIPAASPSAALSKNEGAGLMDGTLLPSRSIEVRDAHVKSLTLALWNLTVAVLTHDLLLARR